MTKTEGYAQKYDFARMEHGEAREKAIKEELEKAIEKQDAHSALELYYIFMDENGFHGNYYNAVILFPEYTAYFDKHPELHEEFNHDLMWSYKWIIGTIGDFPQLPLSQIEKLFDQYIDFSKRFNYNLRSYYHKLEAFMRSNIELDTAFCGLTVNEVHKKFLTTKRDDMSDCKACETNFEMGYYIDVEHDMDKAIKKAEPILNGRLTCSEIPHVTYSDLAEGYFAKNDIVNAEKYARKAIRLLLKDFRDEAGLLRAKSECFGILAFTDPKKSFSIMKKCLPYTVNNPNLCEMFSFYKSAYYLMMVLDDQELEKIRIKLPYRSEDIYREDNIYSISELKEFFYDKAMEIAGKFDKRNGNHIYTNKLEHELTFEMSDYKPFEDDLDIPILDYIRENMDEGELPDDFSLPKPDFDEEGDKFADGARDGIMLYHSKPDLKEPGELEGMIRQAANDDTWNAAKRVEKYFEENDIRTLSVIDSVQNFIMSHTEELDANNIFGFGVDLAVSTKNRESVKLGLAVLELFSSYNDALLQAILDIGACDEFTIFAIWAVNRLENGNDLIFSLAKKAHGWGRIHAVDALEPETDEIKQWLLAEGCNNTVYPGYSAITCFKKADVHTLLENGLTQEQFSNVGRIILFLILDGPTVGLGAFEDGEAIVNMYLDSAEKLEKEDIDIRILQLILANYDDESVKERIRAMNIELPEETEEAE